MPVITRSQQKIICDKMTRKFKTTIEEPFVLQVIVSYLNAYDLIHMRCLSRDDRYTEVINDKLNELKENKIKNNIVIDKVKTYINKIETTKGTEKKIALINEQFEFLCENKWFLEEHKKFSDVVYNKIFELIYSHSIWQTNGVDLLIKMFNVKPPRDYYDYEAGISKYGLFDIHNNFIELYKYPHLEL
jgi:hypothetical protein